MFQSPIPLDLFCKVFATGVRCRYTADMINHNRILLNNEALLDPMALNEVVFTLRMQIEVASGLKISTGRDWDWFKEVRTQVRGAPPSPYFDPNCVDPIDLVKNGFWMVAEQDNKIVFLDAYRLVNVTGDFRSWLIGWLMSAHVPTGEDVIISATPKNTFDKVDQLSGAIAYRGEVWMSADIQSKPDQLPTKLSLLSMALCWQHWQPNAIWGLTMLHNFRAGKMARVGHSTAERDYISWKRRPSCVDHDDETLVYSTRNQIVNQLLNELQASQ